MKIIEIGNKPLKELSAEELRQIVMIEEACPDLEDWEEPVITDFDSNSFTLYYSCKKKGDKNNIINMSFSFIYECFGFYYTSDKFYSRFYKVRLETIKYLINKGYDIPIY